MPPSDYDPSPDDDSYGDEPHLAPFPEWEEESLQKIRLNPRDPEPWLDPATIYFFSTRWDEIVDAISTALLLDSNNAEARFTLGRTYSQVGKKAEGIQALKKAIHLTPDYQIAWMHLGNAFHEIGDEENAHRAYMTAASFASEEDQR